MLDHAHMSPREMLFEICRILGGAWGRKVSPEEVHLRITMKNRYPQFVGYVFDDEDHHHAPPTEGEPATTPTQAIDNLLTTLEGVHP